MSPVKPTEKEEEYFIRQELEKKKKLAEQERAKMNEADKQRLKELHYMRCPKCGMELTEIRYKDIVIDECPTCGGVWLDPGELEHVGAEKDSGSLIGGIAKLFK
ncbi:MAG TPA: zf-TFIIB domain-containing protein [Thermodesulfobacteriota bacterium]|nr:zf-TFIIB domain-containing protein [Deltaproteobacteria bacterium]HNR13278.1 zf-TFIIB domain-containing protein [Thermodesulfobacteriota bacterium]HNU70635.1 zf-TFIIB domain-containing protein [Thermodesulfobacteriota bacterium]HOC38058.1 zf-TFIIB domain-containing protein [Thermodesulfobacteriota bacterium]